MNSRTDNIDPHTVHGFGEEWDSYDQSVLSPEEYRLLFNRYFDIFPWDDLPEAAEGFDLGCGSGRWALGVAPKVGTLHCIDASPKALAVAKRRLADQPNVHFHEASVADIPLPDSSQDFGYSLGVLHHVPDTRAGLSDCVKKLKAGAPFLVYLYYALDDRPAWFRGLWTISNAGRRVISKLPFKLRKGVTEAIAVSVYFPLARAAQMGERMGAKVGNWPLSAYRDQSLYSMRCDALDRFGTQLEQRFTRGEIEEMMSAAGLENIRFSNGEPFWVAVGTKVR